MGLVAQPSPTAFSNLARPAVQPEWGEAEYAMKLRPRRNCATPPSALLALLALLLCGCASSAVYAPSSPPGS